MNYTFAAVAGYGRTEENLVKTTGH